MPVCPSCNDENPQLGAACMRCPGYHYIPESSLHDAKDDPRIGRISAEKYVILGLINEGGMGAVYRALQMPVEREVAVKVLRTELTDSDQAGDRFIREARAVSRLNHPNIITLYDFGFDSNRHPYMVMEYAPGDTLSKWIKSPTITIERIVNVAHQILMALTEAHNQGIVHRDLKPDNMIVSSAKKKDSIKLLDFGIARLINEGTTRSLTREGEVFGTPHYMAPEQAQGKKNVGPPADIYAMGIMLYEMITGECPFDAPTPLAVLFMHINEPLPVVIPRVNVVVPEMLSQILAKATQKEPQDRFQNAYEMQLAMEDLIAFMSGAVSGIRDWTGELNMAGFVDSSATFGTAKTAAIDTGAEFLTKTVPDSSTPDVKSNKSLWLILGVLLFGTLVAGAIIMIPSGGGDKIEKPEVVEKIEPIVDTEKIGSEKVEREKAALAKMELEKKMALEKEAEEREKQEKEALENANIENTDTKKKIRTQKIRKKYTKKTVVKKVETVEKKKIIKKKNTAMKFKVVPEKDPQKFKAH